MIAGLSCNSGLLSEYPVEQAIDILAEEGYQAIDINLEVSPPYFPIPKPHMTPADSQARRKQVRQHAEEAGIAIPAVNAHTSLINAEPAARQANFQFVMDCLSLAADLGAKYLITGSGMKNYYGYETRYWDWLVTALSKLVVVADQLGVTILMEAASFPGVLLRNLETMQKLLGYDGLDHIGVLFDPSHYHVRGDSEVNAYQILHDRVRHVHAKDAQGNFEDFEFPPLGMGEINYQGLFNAMVKAGYSGYISVEYEAFAWGYPNDPRQVLVDSKAFIERFIN